ncbi:hypothetical protein [Streptomyces sp. or20]|uniref:hypothetical protein n=1 Tax=Streptomyces sp. or20 TaxID=1828016 RepID=UPI0011801790|nr:hypothetical protein [Streptomyces sp. or20]
MSDDLRVRVAKALCENDGLNPSTIGYGALWGGYLEAADAVLSVIEPELKRLSDEHGRWESIAGALEFERDELAAKHSTTIDPGSKALREELAALQEEYSERIGRHIETYAERDDLRATIVSQAREIARLKGESA